MNRIQTVKEWKRSSSSKMGNKKKYVSGKFQLVSLIPSIELIYVIWYLIDHLNFFLEIFLQNMQKTKKKKGKRKRKTLPYPNRLRSPILLKKRLYVLVMPRTRFRVNSNSIVAWMSRTPCLKQVYNFASASSKKFLDIQATTECGFTLKHARDMRRTCSKMQRGDTYSQHSSIIWPVRLNGWVLVCELSCCEFESSYSHLKKRLLLPTERFSCEFQEICKKQKFRWFFYQYFFEWFLIFFYNFLLINHSLFWENQQNTYKIFTVFVFFSYLFLSCTSFSYFKVLLSTSYRFQHRTIKSRMKHR